MSRRGPGKKPKVENLELKKETVQDLTESEAAAAEGGHPPLHTQDLQPLCRIPSAFPRNCSVGCRGTAKCPSAVVAANCPVV